MRNDYDIETELGITTIRLPGGLEVDQLLAIIDEVAARDLTSKRLWDVTGGFDFAASEIDQIARRGRKHWTGPARVAFLASDALAFGLLRMFEAYRDQEGYETRVFRDETEARRWLDGG